MIRPHFAIGVSEQGGMAVSKGWCNESGCKITAQFDQSLCWQPAVRLQPSFLKALIER